MLTVNSDITWKTCMRLSTLNAEITVIAEPAWWGLDLKIKIFWSRFERKTYITGFITRFDLFN